jgi:hypothetical protein
MPVAARPPHRVAPARELAISADTDSGAGSVQFPRYGVSPPGGATVCLDDILAAHNFRVADHPGVIM